MRILEMARDDLASCARTLPPPGQALAENLVLAADDLLSAKRPGSFSNEASERALDQGQTLWQMRQKTCATNIGSDEEALRLIMGKLGG